MTTTNLHDEICAAAKQGASLGELQAIVVRHKASGLTQRATYGVLQAVWTELGRNECEDSQSCEALEDLMDRVWGFCPAFDAIWEFSLADLPANE